MNPIEMIVNDLTRRAHEHKDERTQDGIEARILRVIAEMPSLSGRHDFDQGYQKIVTRKIMNPEFAKALGTVAAAVLEVFPVVKDFAPHMTHDAISKDDLN